MNVKRDVRDFLANGGPKSIVQWNASRKQRYEEDTQTKIFCIHNRSDGNLGEVDKVSMDLQTGKSSRRMIFATRSKLEIAVQQLVITSLRYEPLHPL